MIKFWRPQDEYGYMSNFAHYGFTHSGIDYKTNEHYYQSQKHVGTEWEEKIYRCHTPRQAADMGRSIKIDAEHWNKIKLHVMRQGLLYKFTDNTKLNKQLVQTRGQLIVEDSPYDSYWGLGKNGTGLNWLGRLIMEVRNMLIDYHGIYCERCQRHVSPMVSHVNYSGKICATGIYLQ